MAEMEGTRIGNPISFGIPAALVLLLCLADDGRWLQPDARAQMQAWVEQSPRIRALVEARARLAQVLTARSHDAADRLHQLQAWCHEAEASGIRALQDYAARLKGYSLQATRA
jgi:stearoyl-CoA desaturase (delta-9 desaturase)